MEILLDFPSTVNLCKDIFSIIFYHNSQTKSSIDVYPLLVADVFLGVLSGQTWDVSMKAKEMKTEYPAFDISPVTNSSTSFCFMIVFYSLYSLVQMEVFLLAFSTLCQFQSQLNLAFPTMFCMPRKGFHGPALLLVFVSTHCGQRALALGLSHVFPFFQGGPVIA